jgi:hypothetical protein
MRDGRLLACGDWPPGSISVRWGASTFAPPPRIEALIAATWAEAAADPSVRVFDGPLCRLEAIAHDPAHVALTLSRTSYRAFLGTNGRHAEACAAIGAHALASPLGTSAVVISSDGQLVFGVRSAAVALYPHRAHPFGGCLEPGEGLDPFADTLRELGEELAIARADVRLLRLIAIAEDLELRQPELLFACAVEQDAAALARGLDAHEHGRLWSVGADAQAIAAALAAPEPKTPLTRLALEAVGRWRHGGSWRRDQGPG